MPALWIVLGLTVVAAIALAAFYNGLVRGKNAVAEAWSGIDVQLKRRHDLIPNLLGVIKQYASHERSLFEEVAAARARSMHVINDMAALAKAENALSGTLRSLFAVAEAYPDLKANGNFLQLQHDLGALEDELQMARRYYNGTARDQNNRVSQFPGNLVASRLGFGTVAYFELDTLAEKTVPDMGSLRG